MTNDSAKFVTADELTQRGFQRASPSQWHRGEEIALALLVGKTIWHFDHRANHSRVNLENLQVASSSKPSSIAEHTDPAFSPEPQFWVVTTATDPSRQWSLAFRDITNPTNARTAIAAIVPHRSAGNTLPLLLPANEAADYPRCASLMLANMNSLAFDFVTRQKAKWTHLNWFILEQLPVITPARFDEPLPPRFTTAMRQANLMNGHHEHPTVADFVLPQVLALSYTAHDLAPFARDLGYVGAQGDVLPPFIWNEEERRARRAALDALFMHLYGLTAEDAAYVLDSFPIVRKQDEDEFGRYRTKEDVLALLPLLSDI
jgi:hypothetical protein